MQQELNTHLKLHSKFTFDLQIYHFFCTSWTICAQIVARRESVAVPGRKDERITHKKMACQDIHNWGCGCWIADLGRPKDHKLHGLAFEKIYGKTHIQEYWIPTKTYLFWGTFLLTIAENITWDPWLDRRLGLQEPEGFVSQADLARYLEAWKIRLKIIYLKESST